MKVRITVRVGVRVGVRVRVSIRNISFGCLLNSVMQYPHPYLEDPLTKHSLKALPDPNYNTH